MHVLQSRDLNRTHYSLQKVREYRERNRGSRDKKITFSPVCVRSCHAFDAKKPLCTILYRQKEGVQRKMQNKTRRNTKEYTSILSLKRIFFRLSSIDPISMRNFR